MPVQVVHGDNDDKPIIIIEEKAPEVIESNYVTSDEMTWKDALVWLAVMLVVCGLAMVGFWVGEKYSDAKKIQTYQEARTLDEKLDFIYQSLEELKAGQNQEERDQ